MTLDPTLRELLDERHKAHAEEHRIHEHAHEREHEATEQAIKTATIGLDKRLDAMNEFRDQLRDQASTFVRQENFDTFKDERRHALSALEDANDRRFDELRQLIATEREERRAAEGVRRGMSATTAIIVTAIGVVGTVLGIIIVGANLLTGGP
jgi:hypothetical protein